MLRIIQASSGYWEKKLIDSKEHLQRFFSILSCEPKELVLSKGELYICLLHINSISGEVEACLYMNVEHYDEEISIVQHPNLPYIAITTNSAVYTLSKAYEKIDVFEVYTPISSMGYLGGNMLFVAEELCVSFVNEKGYLCFTQNTGFIEEVKLQDKVLSVRSEDTELRFVLQEGAIITECIATC